MDGGYAGKSVADVKPDHGWHTFAADHLALIDHLGFKKFHVMGGCIGGSYCFEAIATATKTDVPPLRRYGRMSDVPQPDASAETLEPPAA